MLGAVSLDQVVNVFRSKLLMGGIHTHTIGKTIEGTVRAYVNRRRVRIFSTLSLGDLRYKKI